PWTYPFMNPQYPSFSQLWKPPWMPMLFIVRVPEAIQSLDEKTYLALMQTRLDWMIQRWVEETSPESTQQFLVTSLSQLDSAQESPMLETNEELDDWRQQWAETLILHNWRFQERLRHYGASFPATVLNSTQPGYPDWLALHEETTLEDWLINLIP
ncbi:MAG: hypothetical protein F6J97_25395, partial [Leptolyngbya sp. SIO4C1]|nr:hypothetical protein [Leptolyngbya sp. SIO4C1]